MKKVEKEFQQISEFIDKNSCSCRLHKSQVITVCVLQTSKQVNVVQLCSRKLHN